MTIQTDGARMQKERARREAPQGQRRYSECSRVELASDRLPRRGGRQALDRGVTGTALQMRMALVIRSVKELARVLSASGRR